MGAISEYGERGPNPQTPFPAPPAQSFQRNFLNAKYQSISLKCLLHPLNLKLRKLPAGSGTA